MAIASQYIRGRARRLIVGVSQLFLVWTEATLVNPQMLSTYSTWLDVTSMTATQTSVYSTLVK